MYSVNSVSSSYTAYMHNVCEENWTGHKNNQRWTCASPCCYVDLSQLWIIAINYNCDSSWSITWKNWIVWKITNFHINIGDKQDSFSKMLSNYKKKKICFDIIHQKLFILFPGAVFILHWLCLHPDRPGLCGRTGESSGLLLRGE